MFGPHSSVRRQHVAVVALALVVALAAAACGSGVQESSAPDTTVEGFTPGDPSTTEPPETTIDFGTCDVGFGECGTVTVPLDYSEPEGQTIYIEVARVPAANPAERIGVLLTNPGGPGASATTLNYNISSFTLLLRKHQSSVRFT